MTPHVIWVAIGALLQRLLPAAFLRSPLAVAAEHPWKTLAAAVVLLAAAGFAVAASGLVPMRASAGHFPLTERFLHFAMRRSVATNASLIQAPMLDDPALVLRGAGHYDLACRACHGGGDGDTPLIPQQMEPPPRALRAHAHDWEPRDLFYIVKHGMKFTGMPAWPAQQRDDEVWAMVAFLRRLPSLDEDEYGRLTRGGMEEPFELGADGETPPRIVTDTCARCHALDGRGRGTGAFPALAGQRAEYLDRAMRAYADGRRHSGIMGPIAAALSDEDRAFAIRYYASLPAGAIGQPGDPSRVARGGRIAAEGIPNLDIPACRECHGPSAEPKNPAYPRLAGQYAQYLALQLRLLRDRQRGGSEYVHLMHTFVDRLSDEELEDAAAYYAATAPAPQPASAGTGEPDVPAGEDDAAPAGAAAVQGVEP